MTGLSPVRLAPCLAHEKAKAGRQCRSAFAFPQFQAVSRGPPPCGRRLILPSQAPAGGFRPSARPAASSLCSPFPANPCASVPGSKIFTFPSPVFVPPRARRPPLFVPPSPRTLVAPFRGAKSSHSRRRISPLRAPGGLLSLLPPPRKPLCLRSGEQNLHISAGSFCPSERPPASSLCSPFPTNPCASVPGSKIFTFPPPDFVLSGARRPPLFAPRSPQTLVPPFRGAKSSHSRRRFLPFRVPGDLLSLLPVPANPCGSVSGSKIFTFPPPDFTLPRTRRPPLFAPRPQRGRNANPRSHFFPLGGAAAMRPTSPPVRVQTCRHIRRPTAAT